MPSLLSSFRRQTILRPTNPNSRIALNQGEDCKRQLAILFSFLEEDQPTESIKVLLGEIDNGQVNSLVLTDPGGGYTGNVPKVGTDVVATMYCCCIDHGVPSVVAVADAVAVAAALWSSIFKAGQMS